MSTTTAIEAVRKAMGAWTTADWTHALVSEEHEPVEGDTTYCEGDNDACETCRAASENADEARDLGERAIAAIEAGEWRKAVKLLEDACAIEREWGDAPVYTAALTAVREAAPKLWEQARSGLTVSRSESVVRVADGADVWLCRREEWDAAEEALSAELAHEGEDEIAIAYDSLVGAVDAPVASTIGTSRDANEDTWRELVADAVREGLIDADEAARRYGVEVAA